MIGQATLTVHAGGTVSVELDPADADTFEISTHLLARCVDTINGAPIVQEFIDEAERAHVKHGDTSMRSQPWNSHRRVSILAEELGEVARPLLDLEHGKIDEAEARYRARAELVQLGAMVLDWIAALTGEETSS